MVVLFVGFSVSKRFEDIFGRIDIRILKIATALVWIFFFLFPGLDLIGQVNGGEASVNYNTDIVCYVFYLMMGCYLSFCRKSVFAKKREILLIVVALVVCISSEVYFYYAGFGYLVNVGYFLISIVAVLIFDFCNWTHVTLRRLGLNWMVKWLGMASLRIVLLVIVFYPIESFVFRYIWKFPHILMCFQLVLLWLMTVAISFSVVCAVTKVVKRCRKWI